MALKISRNSVVQQIAGLEKPAHAVSIASFVARRTPEAELPQRIEDANAVIAALRAAGTSSFYAAEHAKLFTNPDGAVSVRGRLKASFEVEHGLPPRRAAKMADCVLFVSAKAGDTSRIGAFEAMANTALAKGVPFTVAADVVYYSSHNCDAADFARRCLQTSLKQGKPMDVSQIELASHLQSALSAAGY